MGNKQTIAKDDAKRIAGKYEIPPKRVQELHKKWLECAQKGKKTLNKDEFTTWCLNQNIVPDKVTGERIFEQLDSDKNGELEFEEFVRVEVLNKQNKTLDGYVETIFALYDKDNNGTISRQEIVDFCRRTALGRGVPKEKAEEASQQAADMFLQQVDADGDGELTKDEVLRAITEKPHLKGLF
mmetsp:Transcript_99298/g.137985  ORF Transcript_99298/g.137985 Transcript_99298/m.137985 type:complete len:183 (+) Transcript_99298:77-625(+)